MARSQTARTGPDPLAHRRPATERSGTPSTAVDYVRRGLHSGALAGILGVLTLIRARRTLLAGSTDEAIRQGMFAVFWIGTAMTQWGLNRSNREAPTGDALSTIEDGQS